MEEMGVVTNQSPQIYKTRKLQGEVVVIFGAGGSIISQVARELSKEGASVFLSGRAPYNINEDLLPRTNLCLHSKQLMKVSLEFTVRIINS